MRPSTSSCPPGPLAVVLALSVALAACDSPSDADQAPPASAAASAPQPAAAPAPPAPPRPPEIIVDRSSVAIGADHIASGEVAFADKVSALTNGKAGIEGQAVDVVAMRNAKPSQVVDVVAAVRAAKANAVTIKTSARDDTTQKMPLTSASNVPDCTVVAWIDKDGWIDVWPAGGGAVRRVKRGLAGPDMTLGMDAVRTQWAGCNAPTIAVGADDAMTWGLVFDLATSALQAPGSRANMATLLTSAVPGKKLVLP
jgi:hypothetical protein